MLKTSCVPPTSLVVGSVPDSICTSYIVAVVAGTSARDVGPTTLAIEPSPVLTLFPKVSVDAENDFIEPRRVEGREELVESEPNH